MFLLFTSRVTQQTHEYNQTVESDEHLEWIEIDLCFLEYGTVTVVCIYFTLKISSRRWKAARPNWVTWSTQVKLRTWYDLQYRLLGGPDCRVATETDMTWKRPLLAVASIDDDHLAISHLCYVKLKHRLQICMQLICILIYNILYNYCNMVA